MTYLDEWLDLAPALQLLSTHTSRYFPWVAFDPGDNGMWVWSLFGALIQLLNYDNLFASMAALQGDCDFSQLIYFDHPEGDKDETWLLVPSTLSS